ncbi:Tim10/DDP family zinc finger-domain-containing protein [Suillus subalutaceus]|uniref:Tim10/DDP family zinc finger-domain-containing protein n=1 Tax=Suillus subalutaceus TaxID=48586 RepID=UPI001B85D8B1|nr:Tim10/DDP family zinc finger-domain-containing protein [Suillus subalutaceus]KAG1867849.1 Tim10/DDP family zinc finger-domain-containing protein [Suillus subalutaceus]
MDNVKFDEATQKELATFLEREQAQARINSTVHNLTSMCWDKCVTSTPGSRFARGEESCLLNCVDRFMDTSLFIIKTIEGQRSQQS